MAKKPSSDVVKKGGRLKKYHRRPTVGLTKQQHADLLALTQIIAKKRQQSRVLDLSDVLRECVDAFIQAYRRDLDDFREGELPFGGDR